MEIELPTHVIHWARAIFRECDIRITEKLANNPNVPEESLDLTWIEHLTRYSTPVALGSSWIAKIQTHYLGGMGHFYRWEIADIGVLVFVKTSGQLRNSKVALLQSKRLYPTNKKVTQVTTSDYEIGFARLADPEDFSRSIATESQFEFTEDCEYGALEAGSKQVRAIKQYEKSNKLLVYYQLYNPWTLPFIQHVPVTKYTVIEGTSGMGTRVIPAKSVHDAIAGHKRDHSPSFRTLAAGLGGPSKFGWSLEDFVFELLLCHEGSVFESLADTRIQNLFNRRTGAIAAAIAITIEGP